MELTTRITESGGRVLALELTKGEAAHLGDDADTAVADLARALWAVADLRRGRDREAWWPVVVDASRLIRRLEGVRDAALREMPDASHGETAVALGLPRQTVASRRRAGTLPPTTPTDCERWARTGEQPQH